MRETSSWCCGTQLQTWLNPGVQKILQMFPALALYPRPKGPPGPTNPKASVQTGTITQFGEDPICRLSLQLPPQAHTRSFCTHAPCRGGLWLLFKPFNKPFNNFNNNNIYLIIIIIIIIRLRAMASWELLHISYCRGNETQPFHFFSCFENTA